MADFFATVDLDHRGFSGQIVGFSHGMLSLQELELRKQIIEVCRRLYDRNMLAAADGNVSAKISESEILITPSGKPKAYLYPEDLAVMNVEGEIISGKPSAERIMHLEVYRRCPEAQAVVHAHPPNAIAWSIAEPELKELPAESLSEVILAVGSIPVVPYAWPTTKDMADHLVPYLPDHRVMILARHGGLAWGESLNEAWMGMERLDHAALILGTAKRMGGLTSLPESEIKALKEMRQQMGGKTL